MAKDKIVDRMGFMFYTKDTWIYVVDLVSRRRENDSYVYTDDDNEDSKQLRKRRGYIDWLYEKGKYHVCDWIADYNVDRFIERRRITHDLEQNLIVRDMRELE